MGDSNQDKKEGKLSTLVQVATAADELGVELAALTAAKIKENMLIVIGQNYSIPVNVWAKHMALQGGILLDLGKYDEFAEMLQWQHKDPELVEQVAPTELLENPNVTGLAKMCASREDQDAVAAGMVELFYSDQLWRLVKAIESDGTIALCTAVLKHGQAVASDADSLQNIPLWIVAPMDDILAGCKALVSLIDPTPTATAKLLRFLV